MFDGSGVVQVTELTVKGLCSSVFAWTGLSALQSSEFVCSISVVCIPCNSAAQLTPWSRRPEKTSAAMAMFCRSELKPTGKSHESPRKSESTSCAIARRRYESRGYLKACLLQDAAEVGRKGFRSSVSVTRSREQTDKTECAAS